MRNGEDMIYSRGFKIAIGIAGIVILLIAMTERPCRSGELSVTGETSRNQTIQKKDHKIVVLYFHGTFRCFSCKRIEQLTTIAVEEGFSKETKNGLVEMKVINVDKPENKHFIKDYQLYTKSVILSDYVNGKEVRWKNLQRIWELFRNEKAFVGYIQKELRIYMKGTH
jgi:hypothetical protein